METDVNNRFLFELKAKIFFFQC